MIIAGTRSLLRYQPTDICGGMVPIRAWTRGRAGADRGRLVATGGTAGQTDPI